MKLKVAFSLILVFRMCTINVDCKDWRFDEDSVDCKGLGLPWFSHLSCNR